jgi:hypothetical protein
LKPDFNPQEELIILSMIENEITCYMTELEVTNYKNDVNYLTGEKSYKYYEGGRDGNPHISFEGPVWSAFKDPGRFAKRPLLSLEQRIQDMLNKNFSAYFEFDNCALIVYLGPHKICASCSRYFSERHKIKSGLQGICGFDDCNNNATYLVEFRDSPPNIFKVEKGRFLTRRLQTI